MKITITIDTGNAAFEPDPGPEVARILRTLADTVEDGCGPDYEHRLRDSNGNTVGIYKAGKERRSR